MSTFICAIDLGSTLTKAAIIDSQGEMAAVATVPSPQPEGLDGRFDPELSVERACQAIAHALTRSALPPDAVCGVVLSSQRASLIAVDRSGRPAARVWSWQGVACEQQADRFYEQLGRARFRAISGLPPSPIYSVAKLAHLRATAPGFFRSARRFVLLHDYVLARLGAPDFVTDPSNASASGLWDTTRHRWSPEILEALELHEERLPACETAGTKVGALHADAARTTGLLEGTPLYVGGADQQCAVLGAGAVEEGTCVLSLGTAAAVLCPVVHPRIPSTEGVLCTAHLERDRWVLEGFQSCFGGALQWAGAVLGTNSYDELERLALESVPGAAGLLFLPFLTGIGSPEFDNATRGAWLGLSLSHARADLARAVLEGVVLETSRIVERMHNIVPVRRLRVVGGGAGGDLILFLLANATRREVEVLACDETALLGAAAAGWTGAGRFPSVAAAGLALAPRSERCVVPEPPCDADDARIAAYRRAVCAIRAASRSK